MGSRMLYKFRTPPDSKGTVRSFNWFKTYAESFIVNSLKADTQLKLPRYFVG
ncbi:MAG: hypothetical protein QXT36_03625 [Candidatus Micrarchaeaceae archaeon]